MLYLILGRAGSGKSTTLHRICHDRIKKGEESIVLLVPEQESFSAERDMLTRLGEVDAQKVDVVSFTRLAENLRRVYGGADARPLTPARQILCMHQALSAAQDRLTVLRSGDASYIPYLLEFSAELRAGGETPESLDKASRSLGVGADAQKCRELAGLLQNYESILSREAGGVGDSMGQLLKTLRTQRSLQGKTVLIDAFRGFTGVQNKILGTILAQAENVYVTLTAPDTAEKSDCFAHSRDTARQLIALAKKADCPVETTHVSSASPYHLSPALLALEDSFLHEETPSRYTAETEDIVLASCADMEAECAVAAARIKWLLREKGCRCREIAVLARDYTAYAQPFADAMRRAEIPVFADARQSILPHPLSQLVLAGLHIAAQGFSGEQLFRALKTGLFGLETEEIAALEDYALLWRVEGEAWTRPWVLNPDGLRGAHTQDDGQEARLAALNALRLRVTNPLMRLRRALQGCGGQEGATAVFHFLTHCGTAQTLKKWAAESETHETARGTTYDPESVVPHARIWDAHMRLLDEIAAYPETETLGAVAFLQLFRLLAAEETLGELPQSLDAVLFGALDRARPNAPRAVFVLGCAEGVFPKHPAQDNLISDALRRKLQALELRLRDTKEQQLALEQLLVYQICALPREILFLSRSRRDPGGAELPASPLFARIAARFPHCATLDSETMNPIERLAGKADGFSLLCAVYHTHPGLRTALDAYYTRLPGYAGRRAALARAVSHDPAALTLANEPAAAQAVYAAGLRISPSGAETYYQCPFSYFCGHYLNAQAPGVADIDNAFRGGCLHFLLETLLKQIGADKLAQMENADLETHVRQGLAAYGADFLATRDIPARLRYLYDHMGGGFLGALRKILEGLSQSAFRPAAFELNLRDADAVRKLTLDNGATLEISGRVDRVDTAEIGGEHYVRIVDYKSGVKNFDLGAVGDGVNLQMPVYLFALEGRTLPLSAGDAPLRPAGILYQPVRLAAPRNATRGEKAEAEPKASGLTLDDAAVIRAMDEAESGLYAPLRTRMTAEDFTALRRQTDKQLKAMSDNLRDGKIPAIPYRQKQKTTCEWCAYAAACGHESRHPVRLASDIPFAQALAALRTEFLPPK
jgi:ATP-dependent helicase/nuclease subunit B